MKLLGLTGGIACGKSTLADLLRKKGAVVIDADQLVHEMYSEPEFARRVASLFEADVLDAQGRVDRARLGALVFGNKAALQRLELLVHPEVASRREQKLREFSEQTPPPPVAVLEAVKLIESGQANDCDVVWCVVCSPDTQLRRLIEKRSMPEEAARARLASQPPFEEKQRILAEQGVPLVCIHNDGSLPEMEEQVQQHWNDLLELPQSLDRQASDISIDPALLNTA